MTNDQRRRHTVRPGLTGLAQVSGRNNITWEQKFEFDLKYLNRISFFGDIKILVYTVIKVLKRSDIEREGTVSDIDLGDWLLMNEKISNDEFLKKKNQAIEIIKAVKI